jgi:hypothetical protein
LARELFALLLTVDAAVVLGVVDPSGIMTQPVVQNLAALLAATLGIGSIVAAMYAIESESRARAVWLEYCRLEAYMSRQERVNFLAEHWLGSYLVAWTIRAAASTLHLVWIVRVPKWIVS